METNNHHILYCRRKWNKGGAKVLRSHWYLQVEIPMHELHEPIHHFLNGVPVPSGRRCAEAIGEIKRLEKAGALKNNASIMTRIDVLLCIWEGLPDTEATCSALRLQKAIAEDYYNTHPR